MGIARDFENFVSELQIDDSINNLISYRAGEITKKVNKYFWTTTSTESHSLYAGSYGRKTAIATSDIDMIVELPWNFYYRFNDYTSNGQSQLLNLVKECIKEKYPSTCVKGDGQVVVIDFSDGISFEIVPAFLNEDNSYKHIDTHKGGSWQNTNPRAEIDAMNELNKVSNSNLKRLCKMVRAWKVHNNVNIKGILIDTLAYKFMKTWKYKDKSYLYYDFMSRDFFKFLINEHEKTKLLTPGSGRYIVNDGAFKIKAKQAYNDSIEAIRLYEEETYEARCKWRNIYGKKFPR